MNRSPEGETLSYLHQSAPLAQPTASPTITPDDLAAPWRRIVAVIIDGLLLGFPIGFIVGFWLATQTDAMGDAFDASESVNLIPAYLLAGLAGFLYQVPPVAIWGQTLGKKIMAIRIVSGQDVTQPGWWRAVRRWGIYVLVGMIPIVGALFSCVLLPLGGLVMLFVHHKRQVPHDLVADTLVVNDGSHAWA